MTPSIAPPPPDHSPQVTNHHLMWPVERFYWGIMELSSLPKRRRPTQQQLGYLFENVLPGITIEQIHAQYCNVDSKTCIACGLPAELLLASDLNGALTLTPEGLPAFIKERLGIDQTSHELNFLNGPYKPKRLRTLDRRWAMLSALMIVVCAGAIVVGLQRRISHLQRKIREVNQNTSSIHTRILPTGPSNQPPQLRLVAELRQLEQTRSATAPNSKIDDCSPILAGLIQSWPVDAHLVTESISITPAAVTIRGQVPAMADSQTVANAFNSWGGWKVAQPQSESRKDQVDLTLRIDRETWKDAS